MQTLFVFLVLIVMPDGEHVTASRIVDKCPDVKMTYQHYEAMKKQGALFDWNANCFTVNVLSHKQET
tara:strand:+ start:2699 stop:2899 length:201 start_codon:yes stop_codon:yes gene_type:complete